MKAPVTPNQLSIIKEITSRIAVSRIYQIGHRHGAQTYDGIYRRTTSTREHFDLLVVVDGICDQKTFGLQEVINSHSATGVSVSLWVHSAVSIEESLYDPKNGYFFHLVLSAGKLIYQMPDDDDFDNVLDPGELSIQAGHHQIWAHGYHRANVLLLAASNIGENDAGAIKLWLLHQAMKQLCLAFIFKMIGYRPNQRSLGHLLGICRCITPVVDEVFPTFTKWDQALFSMLIRAGRKLHYYSCKDYDLVKINLLHQQCASWMEKAKELAGQLEDKAHA